MDKDLKIALTFDIDWAVDEMLYPLVNSLEKLGIKATFFATHTSTVIKDIEKSSNFEVGIHPNYYPLFSSNSNNVSMESITNDIINLFPKAVGVRTHGLISGFPLLQHFSNCNFKYDASMYIHEQYNTKPFPIFNNLIRIPHSFEDDVHFSFEPTFKINLNELNTNLFVADFHPFHVAMNTPSNAFYDSIKTHYKEYNYLKKNVYSGLGTANCYNNLIDQLKERKSSCVLMKEIELE